MANNPKERQQWILDELKVSPMESLETEIWKEVENYPDYDIRSYGRVKSYKRSNGHSMSLSSDGQGYLKVNFDIGGKNKSIKVHRLVASAFVPVKSIASRFDISDNHTRQIIKEEAWKM